MSIQQPSENINNNLIQEINLEWCELKSLIEEKEILEILERGRMIHSLVMSLRGKLIQYIDNSFGDSIESDFLRHEMLNKLNLLTMRLSDKRSYERSPQPAKAAIASAISLGVEQVLACIPLVIKVSSIKNLYKFTASDLLKFIKQRNLSLNIKFDDQRIIHTKYHFMLIVLIINELITNSLKKGSKLTDISVNLSLNWNSLIVTCFDSKGLTSKALFDLRQALNTEQEENPSTEGNKGFGLKAIKRIGIGVEINSDGVRKGTTVTLRIPIDMQES